MTEPEPHDMPMQRAVRQLRTVGRYAKLLLLLRRLGQWVAAMGVSVAVCVMVDYALRLPGWLRLGLGLSALIASGVWLARRAQRAVAFNPGLSVLALRAEHLFPGLAGSLASGVELSDSRGSLKDRGLALAGATMSEARHKLTGLSLMRLLRWRPTAAVLLLSTLVITGIAAMALAAPEAGRLAAMRWFLPLGDAEWPRRTLVVSRTTTNAWPVDTPVNFRASVQRGYDPGMRTWLVYRYTQAPHAADGWRWLLMNEQQSLTGRGATTTGAPTPGDAIKTAVFEKLVDFNESSLSTGTRRAAELEFYFTADDGRTDTQRMMLVERPEVAGLELTITPPAYAEGLIDEHSARFETVGSTLATVSALRGSTIAMRVGFSQPLKVDEARLSAFTPGMTGLTPATGEPDTKGDGWLAMRRIFVLNDTVQTPIRVTNEHGLDSSSQRAYRIESIQDRPPGVTVVKPVADEDVLATAVITLEAAGVDDVAMESLALEHQRVNADTPAEDPPSDWTRIAVTQQHNPRLDLTTTLDLATLELAVGDHVNITALGHDIYHLDGQRHEPVRSAPRVLRIVDPSALVLQVRTELAAMRQQLVRLETQQQSLAEQPADEAVSGQSRVTSQLQGRGDHLDKVRARIEKNRLDNPPLTALIDRVDSLLDRASDRSQSAHAGLEQAGAADPDEKPARVEAAREQQRAAARTLKELIAVLDQGRDAMAHQAALQQMLSLQEALAEQTAQLWPHTAGATPEQLSEADRDTLRTISERQRDMAQQARALAQQMRMTAEVLSRHSQDPQELAVAQALTSAAQIAEQQGLAGQMQQASGKIDQNRLSSAGEDQQQALDAMTRMLSELTDVERRAQALLKRHLVELSEVLKRLIRQQEQELERLRITDPVLGLDDAQSRLRRNTLAVAEQARGAQDTAGIGDVLDRAVEAQGRAVGAIRGNLRRAAERAELEALAALREALQNIRKLQEESDNSEARRQRQQLREAYEKLAEQQHELRTSTEAHNAEPDHNRRWKAGAISLGHTQVDLQVAAGKLLAKVTGSMTFEHLHTRIDELCTDASRRLRAAEIAPDLLEDQLTIALTLETMAQALAQDDNDDPFGDSGGGGGGGGGSSGKQSPLVPPLAELKAIRGIQESINKRTRLAHKIAADTADTGILHKLSAEQRALADLGKRLHEQLTQSMPPTQP